MGLAQTGLGSVIIAVYPLKRLRTKYRHTVHKAARCRGVPTEILEEYWESLVFCPCGKAEEAESSDGWQQ